MVQHDEFMADPAFRKAWQAAQFILPHLKDYLAERPESGAKLVAMIVLGAFAAHDGLEEPHIGRLARFVPDLAANPLWPLNA